MFHLFTHAFFKALLFLGAGSVIHAMHHEQDMRFYGGLRKAIPLTFAMMTIGTLALTGFFFTAGYYSKDAILEAAFASGTDAGQTAFFVGALVALMTSFYSWRLVFLTFFGAPRWAGSEHISHAHHGEHDDGHHGSHAAAGDPTGGYHPHESPWTMTVPLVVLAVGALLAGVVFHDGFVGAEGGVAFWGQSIAFDVALMDALHHVPAWVVYAPSVAFFLGLGGAYYAYIARPGVPGAVASAVPALYRFLCEKWYFDRLYDAIFVQPAKALGRFFWVRGDQKTIDALGPDGAAAVVAGGALAARRFQSGQLYAYALVMLVGLGLVAAWFVPEALGFGAQ